MEKNLKKFGLGLGSVIVILIGAVLIVPGFLNWNEYKDQIEKTASDFSGRNVVIKGDISLALLPTSALSVKDVTVTNLDGGRAEYFLSLKSLEIKVSFTSVISSLFGGKVRVEKFILIDPVVALEVLPDGRANWQLGGAAPGEQSQNASADISLDKFQIKGGQVSFEDMASGQRELLRKINANVKVKSINGPFNVEGSAKYRGLDAELSFSLGKIRPGKKVPVNMVMTMLDGRLKTNMTGGVILSGPDSSFAGKLAVTASDAGDLFNVVDRLKGQKPPSVIRTGQDFAFDAVVVVAADSIAVKDLNMRMGQSRGQGAAEISFGQKTGDQETDSQINILAALSINKLDMDPLLTAFTEQQKQPLTETVTADDGPDGQRAGPDLLSRLSGKLDLKLGALKYNGKVASQIAVGLLARDGVVDISTIQARMPGGSALAFTGQITPPENRKEGAPTLTGDISLNASNLRGLLSWLKADVEEIPSGQLVQFSYKSGIKVTPDLLQLYAIEGKLDALSFKGGVSYALEGRPSYGLSLDIRNFNLDSYVAQESRLPNQKTDLKKSLSLLDEFDASYNIALSNVTVRGMKIRSAQLDGLLLGGILDAKVIKLKDAAGINFTASAQGQNFSSKPELMVKLSADAKSLSLLQRMLKLDDQFDLGRLGQMKLDGTMTTTLEKMDVNLTSSFGASRFGVKGTMRSATLKQFPEIGSADLAIDGSSTSLAALIDQLDLPMTRPRAKDDRPVALKGRIKASSDFVDLNGRINIAAGEIIIKGRRRGTGKAASLDVALDLRGSETREFIRGLGIDFQPSVRKLGPIALKMKVTGSGDQYAFSNIVGDVGTVKLNGSGKLNMAEEKPYFDFNLKAGEIPLHNFLTGDLGGDSGRDFGRDFGKASKKNTPVHGQWTRTAMDLSVLSAYDGRARVSAASLRYNDYVFEKPTFEMLLKDGVVSINSFTGRLFGGDVAMSGRFGGVGKPKMAMTMTLKKASLAQATKSSAGIAPVTGFFDFSGEFTGAGISQHDMISSLSGNGNIVASPGLINGIDIPALSKKLSEMNSNGDFLNLLGATLSGGQTSYNGGVSTIVTKDGKVQFSPFDIELDGAQSNVKMAIDLVNWTIRSDGNLSLILHPTAPPIGVIITGGISNPDVVYKTERLKKYVGAKIAANMLQKLVGGGDGLQGIFGNQPKAEEAATVAPTEDKTNQPVPVEKPKPLEDFGQQLLQKLFKRKPEQKDEPNP